jgi:hypothetical protein
MKCSADMGKKSKAMDETTVATERDVEILWSKSIPNVLLSEPVYRTRQNADKSSISFQTYGIYGQR